MIKRIHVNQHNIRHNAKVDNEEDKLPVLSVKTYKGNIKCNKVIIHGESCVVYSPDKPLSCGAKVYIETNAEITIVE